MTEKKEHLPTSLETPLEALKHPLFDQHKISVWIKREELNHPTIQGNKFHKLKLNLMEAKRQKKTQLLSFGGAYSNHIAALAAAGKTYEFETIGLIRGQELANQPEKWSSTLRQAHLNGMQLEFLDRQSYRQKTEEKFLQNLTKRYPNAYQIPEGGSNEFAILGVKDLAKSLDRQCPNWTHLYTAVGTGGTFAGLIEHTHPHPKKQLFGVSTLKDSDYLLTQIQHWLSANSHNRWQLLTDYHLGGYAKSNPELLKTTHWFENHFNIPLDPIYTSKMVYGFLQELQHNKLPEGSNVILLHTGGLQGRTEPPSGLESIERLN